jgi:negative regulator of flagellin synthesis FlgM
MMKINQINTQVVDSKSVSSDKKKADSVSASPTSSVAAGPEASVNISSNAKKVSNISGSEAVFDTTKVSEIKAAISSGQFKVNAELVADGLISTVKDLIQTQSYKA